MLLQSKYEYLNLVYKDVKLRSKFHLLSFPKYRTNEQLLYFPSHGGRYLVFQIAELVEAWIRES